MSLDANFHSIFEQSPNAYLLLTPHLFIADANAAYLRATASRREDIVGKYGFDAFPHDPENEKNVAVTQLRASLLRVIKTGSTDHIAFVHYRVPIQSEHGISHSDRYWSVTNTPIFDEGSNSVVFILQHVVDVTELHQLRSQAKQSEERPHLGMEAAILDRAQHVQHTNFQLETEWRQLSNLFEQAPGIMAALKGPNHIFEMANAAYCKFVARHDLIGKSVNEAMPELAAQGFIMMLDQVYKTGEPFIANGIKILLQRRTNAELEEAYVDFICQPVFNASGEVTGIFCQGHDVTAWKKAEHSSRLWKQAIEAATNGIMIVDASGPNQPILYVNPSFERMTGYASSELIGRNAQLLQGKDNDQETLLDIRAALREGRTGSAVLRNYRKNGELFWNELSVAPVDDGSGHVGHFIGIQNDITHRKQVEAQLEYLANYDDLTGLANRKLMRARLQQALEKAQRENHMVGVFFIDLDRFKIINDNLGHDIGNELLREISEKLTTLLGAEDTVSRQGGDEFVVVAQQVQSEEEAASLARKLLETVSSHFQLADREVQVTCSIGISLYPSHGTTLNELLRNSDVAMYCAKKDGRNNFSFYTEEMSQQALARFELEADMRHAVERNEFVLHYQPQIDLDSGEIEGFEALVRWQHPIQGLLNPGNFIDLAEETGLIVGIGSWALREACQQAKQWQTQGLGKYTVAVNLSVRQFADHGLLRSVEEALEQAGWEAQYLELEITESLLMENLIETAVTLNQLRQRGVKISVDDFGTGYSSLGYLKRFALDKLKIDRSFVHDITNDEDGAAIVDAIIAMAHRLKLEVVAEGVETESQLLFLKKHHCDKVQGYFFSKAVTASDCARLLTQQSCFILPETAKNKSI